MTRRMSFGHLPLTSSSLPVCEHSYNLRREHARLDCQTKLEHLQLLQLEGTTAIHVKFHLSLSFTSVSLQPCKSLASWPQGRVAKPLRPELSATVVRRSRNSTRSQ